MKIKPLEALDLAMWLKEDYTLYASNGRLRLQANHYGQLRVTRGMEILYEGGNEAKAISIYNENA